MTSDEIGPRRDKGGVGQGTYPTERGAGEVLRNFNRALRQGLLPRNAPDIAGYDTAAGISMIEDGPADATWDACTLSDGRPMLLALCVQGDGLPPALQLALGRTVLRSLASRSTGLEGLLGDANEILTGVAIEGVGQSLECALLLPGREAIYWAGAGRCLAMVVLEDGTVQHLPGSGPPLGMMSGFRYGVREVPVQRGDVAIALSRGAPDLMEAASGRVAAMAGRSASEMVAAVHDVLSGTRLAGTETAVLLTRCTR